MTLLEKETKTRLLEWDKYLAPVQRPCSSQPHLLLAFLTVFLLQVLVSFTNVTLPDKLALLDIHSPTSSNIIHNNEDQLEYENMPYLFFL